MRINSRKDQQKLMIIKEIRNNLRKLNDSRRLMFFFLIIAKIAYDYLVMKYLNGTYYPSHSGHYDVNINYAKLAQGYAVFVLLTLIFLKLHIREFFVEVLLSLLFLLFFLPINSAYYLNNASLSFFVSSHVFITLTTLLTVQLSKYRMSKRTVALGKQKEVQTCKKKIGTPIFVWFSVLVCLVFFGYKVYYNGLSISLQISGDHVYGTRATFLQDLMAEGTSFTSYLVAFLRAFAATASIYLITYSVISKKAPFLVIGLLAIVAEYSLAASKSQLFFLVVIVFLVLINRIGLIQKYSKLFVLVVLALFSISIFSQSFFFLVVRREFYIPSWLNSLYYSFFSSNPKLLWTQDAIPFKWLLSDVYEVSLHTLINNAFFRGVEASPNTGLFAEAFMHFGLLGIVVYPAILALMINWFSSVYRDLGGLMSAVLATRIALSMINIPITRIDFVISYVLFALGIQFFGYIDTIISNRMLFRKSSENAVGEK